MSTSFLGYCHGVQEANLFFLIREGTKKCHRKSEMTPFVIYHVLRFENSVIEKLFFLPLKNVIKHMI